MEESQLCQARWAWAGARPSADTSRAWTPPPASPRRLPLWLCSGHAEPDGFWAGWPSKAWYTQPSKVLRPVTPALLPSRVQQKGAVGERQPGRGGVSGSQAAGSCPSCKQEPLLSLKVGREKTRILVPAELLTSYGTLSSSHPCLDTQLPYPSSRWDPRTHVALPSPGSEIWGGLTSALPYYPGALLQGRRCPRPIKLTLCLLPGARTFILQSS